jgi:hypothetical protein
VNWASSKKGRLALYQKSNGKRMSYLQALQQELRELIGDLDEAKQKAIVRFVGKKVYESWQNGVEHGKAVATLDRVSAQLEQTGKRLTSQR